MTMLLDLGPVMNRLTKACDHYEKTAPTVWAWANDLFVRITETPASVVLPELRFAERLVDDGQWMQPNQAANQLYHLLYRLGRDVTGQAGY